MILFEVIAIFGVIQEGQKSSCGWAFLTKLKGVSEKNIWKLIERTIFLFLKQKTKTKLEIVKRLTQKIIRSGHNIYGNVGIPVYQELFRIIYY